MTTINRYKFSKIIKKYREENDLTQLELASKVSATANTIARWERGETAPKNQLIINKLKEIGIKV